MIKSWLILGVLAAAFGDVAFRWPEGSGSSLALILLGPIIFVIMWLTVRGGAAFSPNETDQADDR